MQCAAPDNVAPMLLLQPILSDTTAAVKSAGSHGKKVVFQCVIIDAPSEGRRPIVNGAISHDGRRRH